MLTLWTCSLVMPGGGPIKAGRRIPDRVLHSIYFLFPSRIISIVLQFLQVIPCCWQPIISLWQVITLTEEPGNEIGRRTGRRRCAINKSNNAFTASCRHGEQHWYRYNCQKRPSYTVSAFWWRRSLHSRVTWLDRVLIVNCTILYLHVG